MKKRKILPIGKKDLQNIFHLFNTYSLSSNTFENNAVVIFEIKSKNVKELLDNELLSGIISNKRKSVFLTAEVSDDIKSVKFIVKQNRALGAIKQTDFLNLEKVRFLLSTESYLSLQVYMKTCKNNFQIKEVNSELIKLKSELTKVSRTLINLLLLEKSDFQILIKRRKLTSLEEKQVFITYNYYCERLDEHSSKIDDAETQKRVEKENKKINEILELCYQIAEKHKLRIPRKYQRTTLIIDELWYKSKKRGWFLVFILFIFLLIKRHL